ncbi:GNAT family N-acetyltransferase [Patescibacteria group bacterium]|nr:GNAT family N-acetyltransferase [Patescibacteria group bacterium]
MKPGKIVFQGKSKSGRQIIFRYPAKDDLKSAWEYINTLSKEKTFILFQGEEVTLENEEKWLEGEINKISERKAIQLFAFASNKLIGISGVSMRDKAEKYIGNFGISLAKDFRGEGIGKLLTKAVLKETGKNLKDLKIITLGVFGNNSIAKKLYESMGFVEFGVLPKSLIRKGKFIDHIYMYKKV